MATRKHIFQLLSSNGDGTGTTQAIGDYSATPLSLSFKHAEKEVVHIHRMIVKVQDSGTFDAANYGNGITLTNGITVNHRDTNDTILETLTAYPVKTTGDWAAQCFDVNHFAFGTGDEIIAVRWTFSKSGLPVKLKLHEGEYLEVYLNDDFTGLTDHVFKVDGYYIDEDL